jgi:hypothetical protein
MCDSIHARHTARLVKGIRIKRLSGLSCHMPNVGLIVFTASCTYYGRSVFFIVSRLPFARHAKPLMMCDLPKREASGECFAFVV